MGRGGDWEWKRASDRYTVSLDGGGSIEAGSVPGAALLELRLAESGRVSSLVGDPVAHGALIARGLRLVRFVGPESVAVTSLSRPVSDRRVADRWGRQWLLRAWPVAFADSMIVALSLPVPDGMLVLARFAPARDEQMAGRELAALADLTQPRLHGTPGQWVDYLALADLRPRLFEGLELDFEAGRPFSLRSRRVALGFGAEVLPVAAGSTLALDCRYLLEADEAGWDLVGAILRQARNSEAGMRLERAMPPSASEPERARYWPAMSAAEEPFDGLQFLQEGFRWASKAHPVRAKGANGQVEVPAVWLLALFLPAREASEQEFDRRYAALLGGFEMLE